MRDFYQPLVSITFGRVFDILDTYAHGSGQTGPVHHHWCARDGGLDARPAVDIDHSMTGQIEIKIIIAVWGLAGDLDRGSTMCGSPRQGRSWMWSHYDRSVSVTSCLGNYLTDPRILILDRSHLQAVTVLAGYQHVRCRLPPTTFDQSQLAWAVCIKILLVAVITVSGYISDGYLPGMVPFQRAYLGYDDRSTVLPIMLIDFLIMPHATVPEHAPEQNSIGIKTVVHYSDALVAYGR